MVLCLAGMLTGLFFADYAQDCRQVRQNTLRLHIVANSDRAEDQAIKLEVRDALLQEGAGLFAGAQSLQQAVQAAGGHLAQWQQTANRVLQAHGLPPTAQAELVDMYFDTRTYEEGVMLPAGEYRALRVTLGEGAGHNWWCVLYPQLCIPAAEGGHPTQAEQQIRQLSQAPLYQPRLKVVEWAQKIGQWLKK